MLAGSPISFLTRLTAFTASPSETFGARLNDSVTTGNCPWWLTAMGAGVSSTREKALRGTCPPLGNIPDEAAAPLKIAVAVVDPEPVTMLVAALDAVLTGPLDRAVADDPPATMPIAPVVPGAPVRI